MKERRHRLDLRLLVNRVRGEYIEMPGLILTVTQACRLWAIDEHRCRAVLDILLDRGFLTRTAQGGFLRFEAAAGKSHLRTLDRSSKAR